MRLTAVEVSKLLTKDVLAAARGKLVIPRAVRNRKATLADFVVANLTPALEGSLNELLARRPQSPTTAAATD